MSGKGIKQRYQEADYLGIIEAEDNETYELMNAGFTKIDDNPSAQTGSRRYVGDKSATKSVKGYDWSAPFETDLIESEKAVEHIVKVGREELSGIDAEALYVRVDLAGENSTTGYQARRRRVAIEVADITDNDGELKVSGNLLGIGNWEKGTFDTKTKNFTPEAAGEQ